MPKEWRLIDVDLKSARRVSKAFNLSLPIGKLMVARGITKPKDIKAWLDPRIDHLHDPKTLTGMNKAVKLIFELIENGGKICVYGDFDVDGVTSVALLATVLKQLGAEPVCVIPDRVRHGYGLNSAVLKGLVESGVKGIVTVDCGISNVEEISLAKELGLTVVVVDHHEPPENLPAADAIIDPKRSGCLYPFKELAGVGLAFKLAQALAARAGKTELAMEQLDLVALGTVADLVPLVSENRILAYHGLERINARVRPGLEALRRVAGLAECEITATHISFGLAPRLNAAGRVAMGKQALKLLLTRDAGEAARLARELHEANQERQNIEQGIFRDALKRVEPDSLGSSVVLASPEWHEGVKGIVASRLVDKFYRPTILFSVRDDLCIGSGRSIPGFDLHAALEACSDLLVRWGGHKAAAGMTLRLADFEAFRKRFEETAAARLRTDDLVPKIDIDVELDRDELSYALVDELKMLAPFGAGNPTPTLAVRGLFAAEGRFVGAQNQHLKFLVQAQNFFGEAIIYRADRDGRTADERFVDLAFNLDKNIFKGRESAQLKVLDLRDAPPPRGLGSVNLPEPGSGFFLGGNGFSPDSSLGPILIDKRETADREAELIRLLEAPVRTAVYVRDEFEAAALAEAIKKAGRLGSEVDFVCAPSGWGQGLGRLIIYQVPINVESLASLCAAAAADGCMMVYLLYDQSDVQAMEQVVESLFPNRQRLATIYRLLKEHGPFVVDDAAALCRRALGAEIYPPATRWMAVWALKVFRELNLVRRAEDEQLVLANSEGKVELEKAPAWRDAQALKHSAVIFSKRAVSAPPGTLLKAVKSRVNGI